MLSQNKRVPQKHEKLFSSELISAAIKLDEEELDLLREGLTQGNLDNAERKVYSQLIWVLMAEEDRKILKNENDKNKWIESIRSRQIISNITNQCYALAKLFGDLRESVAYIERFNIQYKGHQLYHDACLFTLTNSWDSCNKTLWREIIKKNKPNHYHDFILRLIPLAKKIEEYVENNKEMLKEEIKKQVIKECKEKYEKEFQQKNKIMPQTNNTKQIERINTNENVNDEVKEQNQISSISKKRDSYVNSRIDNIVKTKANNILSKDTSMLQFKFYLAQIKCYENYQKNPQAAELFFEHYLSEESFQKYLTLEPKDDHNEIPNIKIDMNDVSEDYTGFFIYKLDSSDPRAAILGNLTSCCQALGKAGEVCAIYGITQPDSGFYVLAKCFDNKEIILAQCWAWRDEKNSIIFDSIESKNTFYDLNNFNKTLVCDAFTLLAYKLVLEHDVCRVLVGRSGATPQWIKKNGMFMSQYVGTKPKNHKDGYTDSEQKVLLAENNYEVFKLSILSYQNTKLNEKNLPFINLKKLNQVELQQFHINMEPEIWIANNIVNKNGKSGLLKIAIRCNNIKMVKFLIEKCSSLINTNLHGDYYDGINHKSSIEIMENDLLSPLFIATVKENAELVKYLIEKKADVDEKHNNAPLLNHAIRENRSFPIIQALMEGRADVNQSDIKGYTPYYLAYTYGNKKALYELFINGAQDHRVSLTQLFKEAINDSNLERVERLIEDKADVNGTGNFNGLFKCVETPLALAIQDGNFAIIKCLIDNKAEINLTSKLDGRPPLNIYVIAESYDVNVMNYLIKNGANVNDSYKERETPLYLSSVKKNLPMLIALLKQGAKLEAQTLFKMCCVKEQYELLTKAKDSSLEMFKNAGISLEMIEEANEIACNEKNKLAQNVIAELKELYMQYQPQSKPNLKLIENESTLLLFSTFNQSEKDENKIENNNNQILEEELKKNNTN